MDSKTATTDWRARVVDPMTIAYMAIGATDAIRETSKTPSDVMDVGEHAFVESIVDYAKLVDDIAAELKYEGMFYYDVAQEFGLLCGKRMLEDKVLLDQRTAEAIARSLCTNDFGDQPEYDAAAEMRKTVEVALAAWMAVDEFHRKTYTEIVGLYVVLDKDGRAYGELPNSLYKLELPTPSMEGVARLKPDRAYAIAGSLGHSVREFAPYKVMEVIEYVKEQVRIAEETLRFMSVESHVSVGPLVMADDSVEP